VRRRRRDGVDAHVVAAQLRSQRSHQADERCAGHRLQRHCARRRRYWPVRRRRVEKTRTTEYERTAAALVDQQSGRAARAQREGPRSWASSTASTSAFSDVQRDGLARHRRARHHGVQPTEVLARQRSTAAPAPTLRSSTASVLATALATHGADRRGDSFGDGGVLARSRRPPSRGRRSPTRAPSRESAWAVAAPMPRPPPDDQRDLASSVTGRA